MTQAAKIQQLQIENQELQLHAASLGSEHEDKVRELVETLHAVSWARSLTCWQCESSSLSKFYFVFREYRHA